MSIRKPQLAILSGLLGTCLVAGLGVWISRPRPFAFPRLPKNPVSAPIPAAIQREKIAAISAGNPKRAEKEYRAFIAANRTVKDPKVQDEVGKARIGIAYIRAGHKDFAGARVSLLEAAVNYQGTGEIDPDFGGVKDEAAYQAAVCLVGEKKPGEARAAFASFLKNYSDSPLAKAAYRRLVRLNGGKDLPEYDRLLQKDISVQEKKAKFDAATCGPRALAYLLNLAPSGTDHGWPQKPSQKNSPSESEIDALAKLCGTTDKGTSLEGMRKALKHFGIESFGYRLNLGDFKKVAAPAILLNNGHFVVVTNINPNWIEIYDPMRGDGLHVLALPEKDDGAFQATVLALSPVAVSVEGDDTPPPDSTTYGLAGAKKNKEEAAKRQKQNEARVRQALKDEKTWGAKGKALSQTAESQRKTPASPATTPRLVNPQNSGSDK